MGQPIQRSTLGLASGVPLPKGLTEIRRILGKEGIKGNSLLNVIGVVKDYRPPRAVTGKTDHKATLTVYDLSTETEDDLQLHIFKPLDKMPPELDGGDIVFIRQAKVQNREGTMSLLSNYATAVHVFKHKDIPLYPEPATPVPLPGADKLPGELCKYVSFVNGTITRDYIPDSSTFQARKEQSMNFKEKFRELKDVQQYKFVDLIAEVVRPPFDSNFERVTLWITDYTENDGFYNFVSHGTSDPQTIHGDAMGYTSAFDPSQSWQGPWGKLCLQLTCFDQHADWVRDNVKAHQWLLLRNVNIKIGRNGNNLEGFLRGDRSGMKQGVGVTVLDPFDTENVDPRLKEALRRKRDYRVSYRKGVKDREKPSTAGHDGKKRLADDVPNETAQSKKLKPSAKQRRKTKRQQAMQWPDLNSEVSCEGQDQPITGMTDILAPVHHDIHVDGGKTIKVAFPFNNASYHAMARVVNYFPRRLEDFARFRLLDEFDCLSDNEDEEVRSLDERVGGSLTGYAGPGKWEWRFDLELEDASPWTVANRQRMWVHVDNEAAQLLTGLNATNLRQNTQDIVNLRVMLEKLWGTLERCTAEEMKRKEIAKGQPPPSSSEAIEEAQKPEVTGNTPFECCIRQFGVEVDVSEDEEDEANAGEGKRWQRVFGLFGTKLARSGSLTIDDDFE